MIDSTTTISIHRNRLNPNLTHDISKQASIIHDAFAFMEFDSNGYILEANSAYLGLIGYDLNDIRGAHHSIFVDDVYSRSEEYKNFWKLLANGEPLSGQFYRYRKNGSKIWLKASYTPSTNEDGVVDKILKLAVEIEETDVNKSYCHSRV